MSKNFVSLYCPVKGAQVSVLQKELRPAAFEWPGLLIWIMANSDLVKKKPVALEVATYKRLSDLAAQLRIDNPGGGFVSMSAAVEKLLNLWDAWKEEQERGAIVDPVSLQAYAANAEANDPQYLEPKNE